MQHWKLSLKCGHFLETSCVDAIEGVAYVPKYVGQTMPTPPVRCCDGDHVVEGQAKIGRLTGQIREEISPQPKAARPPIGPPPVPARITVIPPGPKASTAPQPKVP